MAAEVKTPLAELQEMWRGIHLEMTFLKTNDERAVFERLVELTDAFETRLMELARDEVALHEAIKEETEKLMQLATDAILKIWRGWNGNSLVRLRPFGSVWETRRMIHLNRTMPKPTPSRPCWRKGSITTSSARSLTTPGRLTPSSRRDVWQAAVDLAEAKAAPSVSGTGE